MIEAWVLSWDGGEAEQYAEYVQDFCGVPAYVLSEYDHETVLLNRVIDACQSDFLWFLTPDVELLYAETPHLMAEWMKDHPTVGVLCPNREGEAPYTGGRWPFNKYLADNTGILYRTSVGAYFDSDFIFTGWSDLDFGEEVKHRGYKVQVDPRISVRKSFTAYGSWSAFRRAYNARNRLLLEAKWYWVGIANWHGVEDYNQNCQPQKRIPTMFELAWYSNEMLEQLADSVYHEHPQILVAAGQPPGNVNWEIPHA